MAATLTVASDSLGARFVKRTALSSAGRVAMIDPLTRYRFAVVVAAVLVGTTGTAQALGPQGSTPLGVGAVRALVGAVALWAFVRTPSLETLRRSPALMALGACGVAVYQPAFFLGVDRVGVAIGTVLAIGSGPGFAGLLAAGLGRLPSRRWAFGTAVAVVGGAVMVLARNGGFGGWVLDSVGIVAALAAGFGYALYTTTAQLMSEKGVDSTEALSWQFSLGSLVLIPILFTEPMGWLATGPGLLLALHLGVVTIGVAYALIGYALKGVDAPTVTTLFQVEPVTAAVLAVVVLDESLPAAAWLGAAAVLVGVTVAAAARPERVG